MSKNFFETYTREELMEAIECGANNIKLLQEERDKVQDNWNKLKARVENRYNFNKMEYLEGVEKRKAKIYKQFFDMMCELEGNNE